MLDIPPLGFAKEQYQIKSHIFTAIISIGEIKKRTFQAKAQIKLNFLKNLF